MLSLLALFIFTSTTAVHSMDHSHIVRHHNRMVRQRSSPSPSSNASSTILPRQSYTLVDHFSGNTFFDGWTFYDQADPTDGLVNFLSESDARSKGLAYTQKDNTVVIAVDDYTTLQDGQNRNSVRIGSKKTYNQGLFVIDLYAMPHGCSVWPAFWTLGTSAAWPQAGEIDIVEGVHENTHNQYTLHTGSGCSLNKSPQGGMSGSVLGTTCQSSNGDNDGCAVMDQAGDSYGHEFNMGAGGAFVMLWDDTGIRTWRFKRGSIPSDLSSQSPNPSSWGQPAAFWSSSSCNTKMGGTFRDHVMIIDTTLCGQWAGASFSSAGCGQSCAEFVKDPNNFKLAKWMINYVAYYQAN